MQNDYVTKTEFGEFKTETGKHFDDVDKRFKQTDQKIDTLKADLRTEMVSNKTEIIEQFNRVAGMIREQFQHDLKITLEYIGSRFEKIENRLH